jgi:hypothetical protein
MSVDESGHYHVVTGVNHLLGSETGLEFRSRTDGGYPVTNDRNCSVLEYPALPIHCDDRAIGYQDVCRLGVAIAVGARPTATGVPEG